MGMNDGQSAYSVVRPRLLGVAMLLAFALLGMQAWRLQVVEGRAYRAQADYNRVRVSPLPPMRGVIYDRNQTRVAANVPSFVVSVVPADLPRERQPAVARRLSDILATEPAPIYEAI